MFPATMPWPTTEMRRNPFCRGTRGQQWCRHSKSFHCWEYYLNMLKCMYSHCICLPETSITLSDNHRRYIHLEPPIIIRTVIVVVDIATRGQHFPGRCRPTTGRGGSQQDVPWCHPRCRPIATMFWFHHPSVLRLPRLLQSLMVVIVPL